MENQQKQPRQKNSSSLGRDTYSGEKEQKLDENKPQSGLMKRWFYVIIGVLVIAVFAVLIVLNLPKDNSVVNNEAEDSKEEGVGSGLENTELSAGTVTTTIDGKTITYNGAYVVDGIEATIGSGTYESSKDDEVVFLVINGGALKIEGDVTISKTGSEDFKGRGDNYSFYGTNSAIVVVGEKSSVSVVGATINTSVSGANAVVAVNNSMAEIRQAKINTTKDNSRGLHATYGGAINADKVEINTQGGSSAALATDRGSGSVIAMNMTLSTAGAGSPLIYSTGEIEVTNSTGTATGAQIAVVEGKNSIDLNGCDFSANGIGNRGSVDNAGVMIYQSMSGDASVGTGSFTATDSNLTLLSSSSVYDLAPFFFVTNTNATIDLTSTTISFNSKQKFILAAGTSEWGRSGSNGGKVNLTMSDVYATTTEVEADSISNIERN